MAEPLGVSVAFDAAWNDADPTWTRLDTLAGCRVRDWSIDRGRPDEFSKTDTGTAVVHIVDREGLFDPSNTSSPYVNKILPGKQAAISLRNPTVALGDEWHTLFRGFVESWHYALDQTEQYMELELQLVDGFAILARAELVVGEDGTLPPFTEFPAEQREALNKLAAGNVLYGETVDSGPLAGTAGDRIDAVLGDVDWPSELRDVFSLNVRLGPKAYPPGTSALDAIWDALDGEFPGVANGWMSKDGKFVAHGRQARFRPDVAEYGIQKRTVGDPSATDAVGGGSGFLDDFNRANAATLGADWSRVTSIGTAARMNLNANAARIAGASAEAYTAAPVAGGNFEVSAALGVIDSSSGAHYWLLAQMPTAGMASFTGYLLDIQISGGSEVIWIYRGNAGSYTTLFGPVTTAHSAGQVIKLTKVGAVLRLYRNGVEDASSPITDPAPLSASGTYIGLGGSTTTTGTWDNFDGSVEGSSDEYIAPISELEWSLGFDNVFNACSATPQWIGTGATIRQINPDPPSSDDVAGQYVKDDSSIAAYGLRSITFDQLQTVEGLATGNDSMVETKRFATYYVTNFSTPAPRVSRIVFKSRRPGDRLGPSLWRHLCRCEISDLLTVVTAHPGGGGFAGDYYVEGIHYTGRPGTPDYPIVELSLDLSPRANWDTNVFDEDTDPEP